MIDPRLENGLVVVVPLDADPQELGRLVGFLSQDERRRSQRFLTETLRKRYLVTRGRLRVFLAELIGVRAEDIEFEYGEFGKPRLSSKHASSVEFNLSHSDDMAVIAACCGGVVGIDIEWQAARITVESLASQLLSATEVEFWRRVPSAEARSRILEAWVYKEAIVKALGIGWNRGLRAIDLPAEVYVGSPSSSQSFEVHLDLPTKVDRQSVDPKNSLSSKFFVRRLDVIPGFHGALCCDRDPSGFACMAWRDFLRISTQD